MKEFAKDLKTIYTAPDEKTALKQLENVTQKWDEKYPTAMNRWKDNWDVISPIFKFSADVRTAFYTTNAIESQALLKALYLATFESTKKWTMPIRN
jgi:putative transposase